jgi:adenylate cyclase
MARGADAAAARAATRKLLRGLQFVNWRLLSGLVLFTFVLTHFLNHAAGLFGPEWLTHGQHLRIAVTRTAWGTWLLYGAAAVHIGMALWKVARRESWRLSRLDAVQLLFGLAIPIMVADHITQTRIADGMGVVDVYAHVLARIWPEHALKQATLLLVVWTHGVLGLHFWLRERRWYPAALPWLAVLAIGIPLLALAGFVSSAREVAQRLATPEALAAFKAEVNWPNAEMAARLGAIGDRITLASVGLIGAALATPLLRQLVRGRLGGVTIRYEAGPSVRTAPGPTLLEISRLNRVPHAAVCGGRARCSTCRVRVLEGLASLPEPTGRERRMLDRMKAPPNVRLACQIRPVADMRVLRLLSPDLGRRQLARQTGEEESGRERIMAVMFLDIRGFTALSEQRLPYDVVYILNHFFAHAGEAIVRAGGHIDKYLGDGLMAVFGERTSQEEAVMQAIRAAIDIDIALDVVAQELAGELETPLKLGIGLHLGPMVMGRIGYGRSAAVTVIGRTVNTASRLQSLSKDYDCQLVLSDAVARMAGLPVEPFRQEDVAVRGMSSSMRVWCIDRARDIAPVAAGTAVAVRQPGAADLAG